MNEKIELSHSRRETPPPLVEDLQNTHTWPSLSVVPLLVFDFRVVAAGDEPGDKLVVLATRERTGRRPIALRLDCEVMPWSSKG